VLLEYINVSLQGPGLCRSWEGFGREGGALGEVSGWSEVVWGDAVVGWECASQFLCSNGAIAISVSVTRSLHVCNVVVNIIAHHCLRTFRPCLGAVTCASWGSATGILAKGSLSLGGDRSLFFTSGGMRTELARPESSRRSTYASLFHILSSVTRPSSATPTPASPTPSSTPAATSAVTSVTPAPTMVSSVL